MPIDASIYNNVRTPQVELPSPLDSAQKAMTLSQLGMQQRQMQMQFQQQQALRQAYADNTDASGSLNQQGLISSIGKSAPWMAPEIQSQMAQANKQQAEAQAAQMQAQHQIATIVVPKYKYMLDLDEKDPAQAAAVWPKIKQDMVSQGVPNLDKAPDQWGQDTRSMVGRAYLIASQYKEQMDNQLTAADIAEKKSMTAKNYAESGVAAPMKIGAEELGKLNEDVNNPSNRKMTGGLADIVNRADRIIALSNAGAKPNEAPAERTARLNKIMPQIAKEYNLSLAYIMQGGVPTEGLAKELGTDTNESALAELKQKFTSAPAGADQGKLIQEYVNTAQHLRNFAAGRLQEITERSKSAYPFAAKYYPNEVTKITTPSAAPSTGGPAPAGDVLASSASAERAALPANMIRIQAPDGKIYRIPKSQKGEAIKAGGSVVK